MRSYSVATNILVPDSGDASINSLGPESEELDEEPSAMKFLNAVWACFNFIAL